MKGPEHVLLFCTVIMAERRKEYPRPSRNLIKISNNPDRPIGGLDYFCKKIKKHLTI